MIRRPFISGGSDSSTIPIAIFDEPAFGLPEIWVMIKAWSLPLDTTISEFMMELKRDKLRSFSKAVGRVVEVGYLRFDKDDIIVLEPYLQEPNEG